MHLVHADLGRDAAEAFVSYLREYSTAAEAQQRRFDHLVAEHGDDGAENEWAWDHAFENHPSPTAPWGWLDSITDCGHGPELDALVDFIQGCLERSAAQP